VHLQPLLNHCEGAGGNRSGAGTSQRTNHGLSATAIHKTADFSLGSFFGFSLGSFFGFSLGSFFSLMQKGKKKKKACGIESQQRLSHSQSLWAAVPRHKAALPSTNPMVRSIGTNH
jgi:hypothetical protein